MKKGYVEVSAEFVERQDRLFRISDAVHKGAEDLGEYTNWYYVSILDEAECDCEQCKKRRKDKWARKEG